MHKTPIFLILQLLTLHSYSEEILTLEDGRKVVLYDDHTWSEVSKSRLSTDELVRKNQRYLRPGISASKQEIIIACEMYEQGWSYTMPRPKSAKAAWGITDGRTTWYNGCWYNSRTGVYTDSTPKKTSSGLYRGDNQNSSHTWRNGGCPAPPDIYMFLLSQSEGPR